MQVFNAFFKVIKHNIPQMMIYFGIFLALSIAFLNAGVAQEDEMFDISRPSLAIIDNDDSKMSNALVSLVSDYAKVQDIGNTKEDIQDALFFRKVSYVLVIPQGFSQGNTGDITKLERFMIPDSYTATYLDRLIEKIMTSFHTYKNFMPAENIDQIAEYIREDIALKSNVSVETFGETTRLTDTSVYYFNYFAFSLFSIILLGVCAFMITFQNIDLRRRNLCSPVSITSMNLQLILGNFIFVLIAWALMYGLAFLLYGWETLKDKAFIYGVNTFVFAIVCLSLSFMVANIVRNKNAQNAVVNILGLGLSFLSGVFVPQFLLGDTVLRIASFAPTYWYVRANLLINTAGSSSTNNLNLISRELLTQGGFAVLFVVVSVVVIRYRRTAES